MEYQEPPQVSSQQCPDDRSSSPMPGCPRTEELDIVLRLDRLARSGTNPFKIAKYREAIAHLGEAFKIQ